MLSVPGNEAAAYGQRHVPGNERLSITICMGRRSLHWKTNSCFAKLKSFFAVRYPASTQWIDPHRVAAMNTMNAMTDLLDWFTAICTVVLVYAALRYPLYPPHADPEEPPRQPRG